MGISLFLPFSLREILVTFQSYCTQNRQNSAKLYGVLAGIGLTYCLLPVPKWDLHLNEKNVPVGATFCLYELTPL